MTLHIHESECVICSEFAESELSHLFLLSFLCSGFLSDALSLLLFEIALVLLDAGLNRGRL